MFGREAVMNLVHRAKHRVPRRVAHVVALAILAAFNAAAFGQSPQYVGPAAGGPLVDTRSGGVLQESYDYQRGGPAPGLISPATPWYHYGFPVSTYRWGWFGAEHYYPTVWWHHGYYDDCCRFGYRCGY
jgi:hypothetical protein